MTARISTARGGAPTGHHGAENLVSAVGEHLSGRRAAVRRVIATAPSEKRAQTQAALLSAGRALVAEKGVGGVSVGDVCSLAGFSRGAFYSNFTDMDHFVRRLADDQWSEMVAFVRAAVAQALPGGLPRSSPRTDDEVTEAVASLSRRLLAAMPASREFYLLQTEFAAYVIRSDDGAPSLSEGYEVFKRSLQEVLETGLAAIGRQPLLGAEETTELIFAAAERSMRIALMEDAGRAGGARGSGAGDGDGRSSGDADGAGGQDDGSETAADRDGESSSAHGTTGTDPAEPGLTAFLERTLPVLLGRLSAPAER